MKRQSLIKKYIYNFDKLRPKVKRELLYDLSVFNNSILEALVKKIKKGEKAYMIIPPLNKKFTDIPEWSHLKGIKYKKHPVYGTHPFYKTFDEVRGWGGNPAVIGEEWVLAKDKDIFHVPRHEIAHQIHANIISKRIFKQIHSAYKKTRKKNNFIRPYSSMNFWEYFADGVTFYFNTSPSRKIKAFDMERTCNRKLLFKKDRTLYNIIRDIFQTKKSNKKKEKTYPH